MDTMIINQQERVEYNSLLEKTLRDTADKAAQILGISPATELSILIVDNDYIRELNSLYRDRDEITDVLSFAMNEPGNDEPDYAEPGDINILGDVVISLEKAWQQSQEYGHSLERELGYLLAHGFLHLLGYDHNSDDERKAMRDLEEKVMIAVNLGR
jgi:probable rRNA maturation factor